MRGRRSAWTITLDSLTRTTLQLWVLRRKTPAGLARRARAMLLLDQGHSSVQTADGLCCGMERASSSLQLVDQICCQSYGQVPGSTSLGLGSMNAASVSPLA